MHLHRALPLFAAALVLAGTTAGQGVHPLPPGPRALHLRLADADVVAIGAVAAVGEGRIAVQDVDVLRGEATDRFEIKRAPSNPPPLVVGVSALLLLRGARPPYVLVDAPREVVVLRDSAEPSAWRVAVAQLLDAGADREGLLEIYFAWLDGGEQSLRDAAGAALLDPRAALTPLSAGRAQDRARAALDPASPASARRVSAELAASRPEAVATLLAGLSRGAPDPQVVEIALRGGLALRNAGVEDALLRALVDPNREIRRAAVRVAELSRSAAALERVRELAQDDLDESVRREAHEVLSGGGEVVP